MVRPLSLAKSCTRRLSLEGRDRFIFCFGEDILGISVVSFLVNISGNNGIYSGMLSGYIWKYFGIYSGIVSEYMSEHSTSIVVCILEGNVVGMSGPIANTYVFAR